MPQIRIINGRSKIATPVKLACLQVADTTRPINLIARNSKESKWSK
jgi:hypothetical protein